MVQIVKLRAVLVEVAQPIPGEEIATMIADGLDAGPGAEKHALTSRELGDVTG